MLTEQDLMSVMNDLYEKIGNQSFPNTIRVPAYKVALIKAAYAESVREEQAIQRLGITRKRAARAMSSKGRFQRWCLNADWRGTIDPWEIAKPTSPFWRHALIKTILNH